MPLPPIHINLLITPSSFVEAGISVICSSMPSLAKLYKAHIVTSRLFRSLQSRFASSHTKDSSYRDLPELAEKDESNKRRKGPYSIPTTRDFKSQMSRADDA